MEAVQSLTRVGIQAVRPDLHHVPAWIQHGQGDAGAVPDHCDQSPVDAQRVDSLPHEVHPQSFDRPPDVQMHPAVNREGDLTGIDGRSDVDCHVTGGHLTHRGPPSGLFVT